MGLFHRRCVPQVGVWGVDYEPMKRSKFRFEMPQDLVAMYPSEERDESRLMVLHKDTGQIEHRVFKDIVDYLIAQ